MDLNQQSEFCRLLPFPSGHGTLSYPFGFQTTKLPQKARISFINKKEQPASDRHYCLSEPPVVQSVLFFYVFHDFDYKKSRYYISICKNSGIQDLSLLIHTKINCFLIHGCSLTTTFFHFLRCFHFFRKRNCCHFCISSLNYPLHLYVYMYNIIISTFLVVNNYLQKTFIPWFAC